MASMHKNAQWQKNKCTSLHSKKNNNMAFLKKFIAVAGLSAEQIQSPICAIMVRVMIPPDATGSRPNIDLRTLGKNITCTLRGKGNNSKIFFEKMPLLHLLELQTQSENSGYELSRYSIQGMLNIGFMGNVQLSNNSYLELTFEPLTNESIGATTEILLNTIKVTNNTDKVFIYKFEDINSKSRTIECANMNCLHVIKNDRIGRMVQRTSGGSQFELEIDEYKQLCNMTNDITSVDKTSLSNEQVRTSTQFLDSMSIAGVESIEFVNAVSGVEGSIILERLTTFI
jgi:hypothetical protein